jgi:ATP-binding cassette subfamily E protein 1
MPRPGQVLGLVGENGIGKSTALSILSGKKKPNLGRYKSPPEWEEILISFRGSELQNYFTHISEGKIKAVVKPQYVDFIPQKVKGKVGSILEKKDERGVLEEIGNILEIKKITDRRVGDLSGGELQRFAIMVTAIQKADVFMFDEPSSYLDVKQRLKVGRVIRSLLSSKTYVIVVEHDLSILDYISDFLCVLYGVPSAYGVVTMPFGVREGINIFLAGFVHTENLRFRETSLTFKISENAENAGNENKRHFDYEYPTITKTLGDFKLHVEKGSFSESEIVVLLGENGTGKTTFVLMLAGLLESDEGKKVPNLTVSYKPQKISPKYPGTVRQLLNKRIYKAMNHPQFQTDVTKPLKLDSIIDQKVKVLSGGELQRVALVLCLGTPADLYLIDEPSAYLDSEQRLIAAKVIKRFILHAKKTGFVVEHDFIMATYLADRVIVYDGEPSVECIARSPENLLTGMNRFLDHLDVTFRRDPTNFRPRINKFGSAKDQEQKMSGNFFFLDTNEKEERKIDKCVSA